MTRNGKPQNEFHKSAFKDAVNEQIITCKEIRSASKDPAFCTVRTGPPPEQSENTFKLSELLGLMDAGILCFSFETPIVLSTEQKILDQIWTNKSKCVFANSKALEFLELEKKLQVVGKSFAEVLPPDEKNFSMLNACAENLLSKRNQSQISEIYISDDQIFKIMASSKDSQVFRIWIAVLSIDQNNILDTGKQLQDWHYRTLLDFPATILFRLNENEEVVYCQASDSKAIAYQLIQVKQSPGKIKKLIHPDDAESYRSYSRKLSDYDGRPLTTSYRLKTSGGNYQKITEKCVACLNAEGDISYYDLICSLSQATAP